VEFGEVILGKLYRISWVDGMEEVAAAQIFSSSAQSLGWVI